jgi:DNA-directed RNA polymerase beta' subunit
VRRWCKSRTRCCRSCRQPPTRSTPARTLAFRPPTPPHSAGFAECPGHLGHIDLALPVYNPTLFGDTLRLLKLKCFSCHRLRAPAARARLLGAQLMLLDLGRLSEALELEGRLKSAGRTDREAAGVIARIGAGGAGVKKGGKKGVAAAASSSADGDDAAAVLDAAGADAAEDAAARADALLRAVELDCIAVGGPDVGCGLSALGGAGRYSAHVRRVRDGLVADFLGPNSGAPPKSCANCGALAFKIRKDGHSKVFQVSSW